MVYVFENLQAGGLVMIPILGCAVIAAAAMLERLWSLSRVRVVPNAFAVEMVDLIRQQRWSDALTLCRKRDIPIARILQVAVEARDEPRSLIKERVEEIGRREAAELERFTPILGTIAAISPLLGLLGTVGGMIRTFNAIEQQGVDISFLGASARRSSPPLRGCLSGFPRWWPIASYWRVSMRSSSTSKRSRWAS